VNVVSGLRKLFFTAYRVRLFRAMQSIYQYGQSWRPLSVTYIAPGAASMYRTSALPSIDIAAPNLVIEDFNMTFEVQHKRLGRIAYSPYAQCTSEDPFTFRDYCKQIRRWYLGFWQTVRRHGFWPSLFSVSLALFAAEVLAFSVFLAVLPLFVLLWLVNGTDAYTLSATPFGIVAVSPLTLLLFYFVIDLLTTLVVAAYEKRPELILFAPLFPFLRYVDAVIYLRSFIGSFQTQSDGKWSSPTRQLPLQAAPPAPGS
jgi:cellulose synthase/poly-beta-1,6-N-acetylglucosamine synthase-like glycosyltransferase